MKPLLPEIEADIRRAIAAGDYEAANSTVLNLAAKGCGASEEVQSVLELLQRLLVEVRVARAHHLQELSSTPAPSPYASSRDANSTSWKLNG